MTLHIFNPEHDLALASGLANFTAPHAGRQLRHDLGFLPVLWAKEGDLVLVDDLATAERGLRLLRPRVRYRQTASLVPVNYQFSAGKLPVCRNVTQVEPWGWDLALLSRLRRQGFPAELLPSETQIDTIRQLSHRRTAAQLLPALRFEGTVGEAVECRSIEEVEAFISQHPRTVLKAPWSSSGRGIRFVESVAADLQSAAVPSPLAGWLRNVLKVQGSVMAEPYYHKVKDFGMEFEWRDGEIHYLGLSLFHTTNGAYTGNILATEQAKREMLSQYLSLELIDRVREEIIKAHLLPSLPLELVRLLPIGTQEGEGSGVGSLTLPFGIDMMVVARTDGQGFLLHPCVELNLRRTMGHVALALTPLVNPDGDDDVLRVMRIDYANNQYQLKINRL